MATAVSTNDERHASSLIVALEFYPQMAIKMIHKCSPDTVLMMIQNNPNNKFMKYLNDSETKLIPTLSTDGFNKLDMSLLYKLIRHFNLVLEPSEKWGNRPLATNINHGDDMERMRLKRNDLVHRPRGGLSEEERDKFFKESIEIALRVDNFIGDSTSSFQTGIRNVKIHHITQEKYRQVLEKCVELQQQLKDISRINRVDLYYGDDITVKLGHQDLPATDSTRCTIYIRDPNMNVPTIIEQLEQAKKRLNEGSYDVKLLDAKSGSLVLHVEIHNHCFITKDSLHKAIAEFLRRVFTSISGSLDQHIMEVVLAECDSYIISDNEEKNDEYLNDQETSILKLDVMVRNTSLQSETDLYRDVHGFISKVLDITDKDVESTNGSPLAVIMTSQHVDDSSPSGTPEKKKLVGYKIDPDQLKLIKEDEGNTILCNEAKEFTKEGVQGMAFVGRQKVSSVVPPNHFGPIPGIEVGTLWKFRKQVSEAGVHRPHIAGIHGREDDGAYSIVLSGIYEDDKDDGDEVTYTGSGGRDLKGSCHKKTAQSCDQTLTRMNKALTRNVNVPINANDGACAEDWKEGKPVRVVRNYKGRKHSKYAPEEGNRYDGIYKIVKYWPENGKSRFLVWRYLFRRDDPNPAPWSKAGKKKIEELGLTMQYPEGYLEAQAKKDEEAGEVSKKGKRKRDDNDSSPSGTPEKKKKFVGYKIDPDQLKVINEFTKEGVQVRDGSVIEEEEQREVMTATIEFLKIKLEEEGLHFRGSIPNDGNSFFKACSDQLQHLGISGHTHTELRQIVSQTLSFCSENEIKSANFTRDTWKTYINKVAKDKENVEDIVVETMAKLLQRQIIVCSKSYLNGISRKIINEDANGTPLLLAKDKLYYQSLERQHDGTQSRLQESNTPKVRTATIEFLKKKLEEEGLHFHGSIPDDGNSFFKACSDQLQCLEILGHTHTELRQMVIQNLQFYTENEIKSANFTRDTWKIYIDKVAEDNENVEDIVVEAMAKLLRRQIIIYSRLLNSTTEISTTIINEDANETPLLLAKDKLYYQSLERRHGTPSRLQESNTSKREEKERIDMERKINEERIYKEMIENAAVKQKDRDIEIEERERMRVGISSSGGGDKSMGFGISTSRPLPGTSHEKNPVETYVSKVESEEGLNEKKKTRFKKITKDEKMLILGSYISLTIKSDWDKLVDNVYKSRNDALPVEMSKHYEDLYKQNKLKNRIKSYIQRVLSNRINETDTDIKGLIKDM